MSIEIIKVDFYLKLLKNIITDRLKEHVTIYLYENPKVGNQFHFTNSIYPEASGKHLAIDTPNDYDRASYIYSKINPDKYNLRNIIDILDYYEEE